MDAGAFSVGPAAPAAPVRAQAGDRHWTATAATVVLCAAVALAAVVGGAALAGIRTAVVLTGSMRPALAPDTLILTKRIAASQARPGDIVSFASPSEPGIVITHRVRAVRPARDGRLAFTTRGDANNTAEHWTIARGGSMARVVGSVPGIGAVTDWAGDPRLRILVIGLLGLMALVGGLRWVWRRE